MSSCNERSGSHGARAAAEAITKEADFHLSNYGTFAFLTPISEFGCDWADANLPDATKYHGDTLVIEPRYLPDILGGISDAALLVQVL